jgi:chemotaxis methyl-accepting protein methylase
MEYQGPALDLLLNSVRLNKPLSEAIMAELNTEGSSIYKMLIESRSMFGRYGDIYREMRTSLRESLREGPVPSTGIRIAVAGLGLNEEPLTIALLLAETLKEIGLDPSLGKVDVLSIDGAILEGFVKFKAGQGAYPYPYRPKKVSSELSGLFKEATTAIVSEHFDHLDGRLIPGKVLNEMINYHPFTIGQTTEIPNELIGSCKYLTLHNVLQYIGKEGHLPNNEQMAASFQALHATLAPGGKVSEKTEGKLAPSVLKNLESLLKSTAEGSRI